MKDKIQKICQDLEKEHNIKILFAIENGSRAWRMESKDSDYDVRFVFVRPLKDYLRLNKKQDVINVAYDKDMNRCDVQGSLIDLSGFDIYKYIELLSKSNPTTIEWLISDIVYYGEQNKVFLDFAINHFNPNAIYHHYKSLCSQNYEKYLKSSHLVSYKKYLYAYRGLVNALYVSKFNKLPPIIFLDALHVLPSLVRNKIESIISLKKQGKEGDIISNISLLDDFIEKFLIQDFKVSIFDVDLKVLEDEVSRIVLGEGFESCWNYFKKDFFQIFDLINN